MAERSSSAQIPVPFATAAIGLVVSAVFYSKINPVAASVLGFIAGLVIIELEKYRRATRVSPEPRSMDFSCPGCGVDLHIDLNVDGNNKIEMHRPKTYTAR
jgi:hypothetical protein